MDSLHKTFIYLLYLFLLSISICFNQHVSFECFTLKILPLLMT